jgi:hypothetical protein
VDPHLAARAVDAQRDLAAIGDQYLVEHGQPNALSARLREEREDPSPWRWGG